MEWNIFFQCKGIIYFYKYLEYVFIFYNSHHLHNHLYPIFRQVIPQLLKAWKVKFFWPSDICVSAPTGSGKTLAFVLPIIQTLKFRTVPRIRALVILPVQDLANQVFKVFQNYVGKTNLRVKLLSGQKSFAQEQNELVFKGNFKEKKINKVFLISR